MSLRDVFGDREELRHRFPRFAGVVLIESGNDYAHSSLCERVRDMNQFVIKELPFIDADNFSIRIYISEHFGRRTTVHRLVTHLGMRNNLALRKARVDFRFEDLHLLPRDLRAPQTPDQFF